MLGSCWLGCSLLFAGQALGELVPERLLVLEMGPVLIKPQLAIAEKFSDNILYEAPDAAQADLISTLSAGFDLAAGRRGRLTAGLSYLYDQHLFLDRTDLNAGNHLIGTEFSFLGDKLKVRGRDQVSVLSDVLGGLTSVRSNVDRLIISDDYRAEYEFGPKTQAHLAGRHSSADYEAGQFLYDYNTWSATAGFGFLPATKLVVIGEMYYGQSASAPNFGGIKPPHLTFMGGFAGVRGQFSPKLSGFLKAGFESRQFAGDAAALTSPVFDVSLDYQVSPKLASHLAFSRNSGVSVQAASESYVADTVTARLTHRLGRSGKWSAALSGLFARYAYESSLTFRDRVDLWYRFDASLNYDMRRWLTGSFAYEHEGFASDTQGIVDYGINRITLRVSVGY